MGFGSAIGGAYTGSVVMGASMDASKYSTDKIVSENNKAIGSASQMEASLANAAAMQELLAAKQLAAITKVNAMQRTHGGMTSMMSAAGSGRPLLVDRPDTASGGMASAWARTIAVEQAARQRADELSYQISIRLQQNLSSYVIAQIREQQAARQAAIREEFVFRQNQERNMSAQIMQNIRAQQAAASGRRRAGAQETIEGIRNQQFARSAGIAESIGLGRNAPASLNAAQQAIARMRADLNPMVGMEMRLAEEAREVRNYIVQRVAAGRMEVAEARQLTAEFQHHANLLRQRAAHEHQGFLGMRRMGFAAQQLGYAVEDAASQFGTMGLAGAFRAGANNLTAMASVMGPMVGVAASLTAAAVALGIQWWQNRKGIDDNTEAAKRLKAVTDNIASSVEFQIGLQRQLTNARKSDHAQLTSMLEENNRQIAEQEDAIQQRIRIEEKAAEVKRAEFRVEQANNRANAAMARMMHANVTPQERDAAKEAFEAQKAAQKELNALLATQADEAARAASNESKVFGLLKQQVELRELHNKAMRQEASDRLIKGGIEADQSAVDSITQRYESLNPELRIQNEILDSRIKLNEQINIGLRAGQIQVDQAEKYREAFEEVVRLEAEKRAGEQNLDDLAKEQASLIELANRVGTPGGIAGAVKKGTDEAARIIESEKLRRMAAKDQEPVVNELRRVKEAIERQKAALEAIAANIPQIATIP